MFLDKLLEIITIITWILVLFVFGVTFLRDIRYRGIKAAFRNLISLRTVFFLLILLSVTILSAALVFIPPQERGVVISILAPQGVRQEPMDSGLQWIFPLFEELVTYPIYWQTYTMANKPLEGQVLGDDAIVARTTDGQQVIINGSVIFRLEAQEVKRIHVDWQDRYVDELVRPRTRGVIRSVVAKFTVDEVNSIERTKVEIEIDRDLRDILEEHGFRLDTFVLRNITFSGPYANSVEQKQVQEQGQVTSLYEAEQMRRLAGGRADAVVIEVKAEADAIKIKAGALAEARLIRADAEAQAHVIEAEARAEGLRLVNSALEQNPENLLTYQYINRLSPNIKALLLPSNTPLILPLQKNLLGDSPVDEESLFQPANPLLPEGDLSQETLSRESLAPEDLPTTSLPQTPVVTTTSVVTTTDVITR